MTKSFTVAGRSAVMGGTLRSVVVKAADQTDAKLLAFDLGVRVPMAAVPGKSPKATKLAMRVAANYEANLTAENNAMIATMRGN